MGEEQGLEPGVTGDAARVAEPGTVSRLLQELARSPAEDAAASWREPLVPGDVVGRYQIRREIGRGGFGAVYEALDPELGRTVALKALKPGRNRHQLSEEWIGKEAEAIAKLDHPAIVTIFDVGTCPAGAYLVMELLRGETLAKRIEKGPLPVDEALRIAERMAEGLAHAHSRGVLHRDLKPANVFVCADGRVKLLDFGLAHLLGTEGSSGAGTPAYMAPEQATGASVDERADVWAAGMVLGEMLTGKRPLERTPTPGAEAAGNRTELMWKANAPATVAAPRLGVVPRPVARAVGAALAADPAARPKNGGFWLKELRSARLRVDRPRRIRRVTAFATAFVVVGLTVAGLATWRLWERQIPGGRVTVAVADFANETGERELDGLSGLLITSLEQSAALRVLTRSRMVDVLKQLGKGDAERIDEPMAREVGKHSGVRALLLASVRKIGDAYLVEMRALDPLLDEYVFTVKDRAGSKKEVLDLIDRLGATTKAKLGAPREEKPAPSVAAITTTNLNAWDLILRSKRALDLARVEEAYGLAEAALAEDPESPLAKYQMYVATDYRPTWTPGWDREAALREAMEAAEAVADRLPEKERLRLRLHRAFIDRKAELIDPLCEKMTAIYPLDKEILQDCGSVRFYFYYADRDRSVEYLTRALQLDPSYELAVYKLCQVLWTLGGAKEHVALLRERAAVSEDPEVMRLLATTLLAAGAEPDGMALLQRLQEKRGRPYPHQQLATYLSDTGRPEEAERIARSCLDHLAKGAEARRERERNHCRWVLFQSLMAQGRRKEALEASESRSDSDPIERVVVRAQADGVVGALEKARAGAKDLRGLGLEDDPDHARAYGILLAVAGLDAEAAPTLEKARASQGWDSAPYADRVLGDAVADWAMQLPGAEDRLRAAAKMPHLGLRYWAARILAGHLRAQGNCTEVVSILEGLRGIQPSGVVQGRALYRAQHIHWLAECYEKLGDLAKARERNDEFLRLWAKADPDIPLLVEAKAMRERLAGAPGGASSPR